MLASCIYGDSMKSYNPPHSLSTYWFLCKATYERNPGSQLNRHQFALQHVTTFDQSAGSGGHYKVSVCKDASGLVVGIEGTSSLRNWLFNTKIGFSEKRTILHNLYTELQRISAEHGLPIQGFTGHSAGASIADMLIREYYNDCYGVFFNGYAIKDRANYRNLRSAEDELTAFTTEFGMKAIIGGIGVLTGPGVGIPLVIAAEIAKKTDISQYETVCSGGHSINSFAVLNFKSWEQIKPRVEKPGAVKAFFLTTGKILNHAKSSPISRAIIENLGAFNKNLPLLA